MIDHAYRSVIDALNGAYNNALTCPVPYRTGCCGYDPACNGRAPRPERCGSGGWISINGRVVQYEGFSVRESAERG